MPKFDIQQSKDLNQRFSEPLQRAILDAHIPSLGAFPENRPLAKLLDDNPTLLLEDFQLPTNQLQALLAALWLLAGELDRSHAISQNLHTELGSFWHGVMHRREGDFSNAKYWFRRCSNLQLTNSISSAITTDPLASQLVQTSSWDPLDFVDQCQRATRTAGDLQQQCVRAQWIEWQVAVASGF